MTTVRAQIRIPCDRDLQTTNTRSLSTRVVYGSSVSSLEGSYHVPVVLASFQDVAFSEESVVEWKAMLNQTGYSNNYCAGSVSDYFNLQSGGRFNLTFDVMGPVLLPDSMKYYGKNIISIEGNDANPMQMIYDACLATEKDFSPYDWNNDGTIDVVMVIYAGKGENRGGGADAIWPHKYSANGKVGALNLSTYACVSELAANGTTDGYGTFCHEFSHTLGLPDLYPISGSLYSIFDEWDLMDGGNYSNDGYAAPNYSAFERHRCGWYDPVELTSATTISRMPSMDEECVAYKIVDPEDSQRYYLLENRQQQGFDYFLPGNGLIVTYVNHYDGTLTPNSSYSQQVTLITADNRTYHESESFFGNNKYTEDGHNRYLSLAGYPYVLRDSINNHLSDSSIPAMMFSGKPVSNIRMEDGNISFDFMKETSAIRDIFMEPYENIWYDLQGRRLQGRPSRKGIYIHNYKKETIR